MLCNITTAMFHKCFCLECYMTLKNIHCRNVILTMLCNITTAMLHKCWYDIENQTNYYEFRITNVEIMWYPYIAPMLHFNVATTFQHQHYIDVTKATLKRNCLKTHCRDITKLLLYHRTSCNVGITYVIEHYGNVTTVTFQ